MQSALLLAIVALCGVVFGQRPFDRDREDRDNTIPECLRKTADVFFVLDSSSSIYIEDYKEVLKFVSQVITRFDVSRDDTRIGALTFSNDFQLGFGLDRFRSKGEVLASVNERSLPYRTGVTNTDLAIRYVRENNAFRPDITKAMVVITDGGSRSPGSTKREADLARDAGFHMVVVGVGQYLDEQEWRAIASDPDNDYVFNITNFSFLDSLKDVLPRRVCLMPPIILGGECRVTENSDLLFLAAPNGINDALDVIEELADSFQSQNRLQVRYIMEVCQDEADTNFEGPDRFCDRFGDALPQNDETYVSLVTQLRNVATNMREERASNQVAVLFVDDLSMRNNRFGILQEVRNAAQFDGIDIIAVDLGVREYSNFVNGMTSSRENVINYPGQSATTSVQQILDRICYHVNFSFGDEIRPN